MSASAPWSVKGIDAKAREVAKALARQSGMTLGEWLNQMILDGQDVGAMISRERERMDDPRYAADAHQPMARPEYVSPRRAAPVVEHYDDYEGDYDYAPRQHVPHYSEPRPAPSRQDYALRQPSRPAPFSSASRVAPPPVREPLSGRGEISRVAHVLDALSERIESSEGRSANAVRGVSTAIEALLNRLERNEAVVTDAEARLNEHNQGLSASLERLERTEEDHGALAHRLHEAERLLDAQAERLEGLSGHLREEREKVAQLEAQAKQSPVTETLSAIEATLGKLANQLYENDARTRDTLKAVKDDMEGFTHRLSQMELRDPDRVSQQVLDKVISRMAERLESAEARTSGALRTMEQALSSLDARLSRSESYGDVTDPDQVVSLRRIGEEMSRRIDATRQELFDQLQGVAQGGSEAAVKALEGRIEDAEKRSARAVEQMGQDVLRVAETINHRLSLAEAAYGEGQKRLTAELSRVSESVDLRLGRTDNAHAQALERLGSEIARISERLNQKLADADRRTAETIAQAQHSFEQTKDQARNELSERIRQSEARTQKLLEETRQRIEQQLAKAQTEALLTEAVLNTAAAKIHERDARGPFERPAPAPAATAFVAPDSFAAPETIEPKITAPKVSAPVIEPELDLEDDFDEPIDVTARLVGRFGSASISANAPLKSDDDPFEDSFEDELEAPLKRQIPLSATSAPVFDEDDSDDEDPFAEIDQTRKASPSLNVSPALARRDPVVTLDDEPEDVSADDLLREDEEVSGGVSMSTREALAAARAAVRASFDNAVADGSVGQLRMGNSKTKGQKPEPKPNDGGTSMKALKASSLAALIVAGGVGSMVVLKDVFVPKSKPEATTPKALSIQEVKHTDQDADLKAEYADALTALEARAPDAVGKIKAVATKGYPMAQFRLAKLYEGEGRIIEPDKAEARAWYQKAAEGGMREAMYNIGVYYHNGDGGPQDRSMAGMWFRKAAERGVVDAQYNLGVMYQSGDGVALNLSEAYQWFKIAAKGGDADSAKKADEIRPSLSETQAAKADDEVARFVPISPSNVQTASGGEGSVVAAN